MLEDWEDCGELWEDCEEIVEGLCEDYGWIVGGLGERRGRIVVCGRIGGGLWEDFGRILGRW